ncbi:dymeclin isoform X3 [Eurytemora carolleeae]|uniref:dymeclin isoform X3 n=1 Tax=Eurytemora carolleeae TaxID=1294199 RepID=UPI000C76AB7E|nr:dymeclin isoform X3 [Eurytemora carolleeae]|eukprot:XP_023348059.1 dymeclin-like isoform X3 [Eurytemora affinis]
MCFFSEKMGNGNGRYNYKDLNKNELLNRLVSKEVLTPSDPFWNSLLSFNHLPPQSRDDWKILEENTEEMLKRFLISNLKTKNFSSLIKLLLLRRSELEASVETENHVYIWQTCNALYLVRVIVKFMTERIKEEELVKQFNDEDSSEIFSRFLASLVTLLIEIPIKSSTYYLHLEGTKVLIVLLSSPVFTCSKPTHQIQSWKQMMTGDLSELSVPLTSTLLLRYIEQAVAPPDPLGQAGGSLVLGFLNILTLGYASSGSGDFRGPIKPLAECSLSLLMILQNHYTDPSLHNPYRTALFSCSNSSGRGGEIAPGTSFVIEFIQLYKTLSNTLQNDEPTLLLYLLLLKCSSFRNYVFAATDIDQLVLPILQTIHGCVLRGAQIGWYTERSCTDLSLGGLVILVVIRTIQYNMLKMRDKYLHTNCLAALANMSAHCTNLHPYVAQRIVSLFETLARKHTRLVNGLKGLESEDTEDGFDEVSDAVQDAAVLEEVLRMVLEIINSCFIHQIQNNPNLIYAVLYKKEMFELYSKNPAFQDLLRNILVVLTYMASRVDQETERRGRGLEVSEVQQIVREGAHQFPRERLAM